MTGATHIVLGNPTTKVSDHFLGTTLLPGLGKYYGDMPAAIKTPLKTLHPRILRVGWPTEGWDMAQLVAFAQEFGSELMVCVPVDDIDTVRTTILSWPEIRYVELGNELYWSRPNLSGAEVGKAALATLEAIKEIDPTIQVGANVGIHPYSNIRQWSDEFLAAAGNSLDWAGMFLYGPGGGGGQPVTAEMACHPYLVEHYCLAGQRTIPALMESVKRRVGRDLPLMIVEGNCCFHATSDGVTQSDLPAVRLRLIGAFYTASTLNALLRCGVDSYIHHTAVDNGQWGGIYAPIGNGTGVAVLPTHRLMEMYSDCSGAQLVDCTVTCANLPPLVPDADTHIPAGLGWDEPAINDLLPPRDTPVVNAISYVNREGTLVVILANRYRDEQKVTVDLGAFTAVGRAKVKTLRCTSKRHTWKSDFDPTSDLMNATNITTDGNVPDVISVTSSTLAVNPLVAVMPAYSFKRLEIPL